MTEDELRAWIEKVNGNDLEEVRAAGLCALKLLMKTPDPVFRKQSSRPDKSSRDPLLKPP